MNMKDLSERDICSKFISPAVKAAGWDEMTQIREEVSFTKGRILVRGKLVTRGKSKRADYILYYKPNIPIAIIEAKDNDHSVGDGMQQALDYAGSLNIPFVFSSNGDGFGAARSAKGARKRKLPGASRRTKSRRAATTSTSKTRTPSPTNTATPMNC
jgi:type I site-specific restriction endonuclease